MSYSDSPQAKLMNEWHEAFGKKDIDLLTKPLHKDFRYAVYPRSLNMPEQSKDEWYAQTAATINLWTSMDVSRTTYHLNPCLSPPTANPPLRHRSSGKGHNPRLCSERSDIPSVCSRLIVLRNCGNRAGGQHVTRSDRHRYHCHRRRREPEDQENRGVP